MKHLIDNIDELILRYYRNELSNDEVKLLLSWVNESDDNKQYFKKQLVIAETIIQKHIFFDADKGFSEFLEQTKKKTEPKRLKLLLPVAAIILLALGISTIYLSKPDKSNQQQVYTSIGQNTEVLLSDSSQITLRHGAVLKAPEKFIKKQRIVEFKGQAYFNITPDKKRAFKIIIDQITIEVLGTSFEIKTDSISDNVEIRVKTGKVKVTGNMSQNTFILQQGQQLIINQKTGFNKRANLINNNYLAWKTKHLTYQGVRMEEVAADLMELYNKQIIFSDNSLKDCKVTFSVYNQSFDEVILILGKLLNVEVFIIDNKIVLAGNSCDNNL